MPDDDEGLPEPSDNLTRPERFLAEHLTPFRVFWLKSAMNILVIVLFAWAALTTGSYLDEAQDVKALLEEKGCYAVNDTWVLQPTEKPPEDPFNLSGIQVNDSSQANSSGPGNTDPPEINSSDVEGWP